MEKVFFVVAYLFLCSTNILSQPTSSILCARCNDNACVEGESSKSRAEANAVQCAEGQVCGYQFFLTKETRIADCFSKDMFDENTIDDTNECISSDTDPEPYVLCKCEIGDNCNAKFYVQPPPIDSGAVDEGVTTTGSNVQTETSLEPEDATTANNVINSESPQTDSPPANRRRSTPQIPIQTPVPSDNPDDTSTETTESRETEENSTDVLESTVKTDTLPTKSNNGSPPEFFVASFISLLIYVFY